MPLSLLRFSAISLFLFGNFFANADAWAEETAEEPEPEASDSALSAFELAQLCDRLASDEIATRREAVERILEAAPSSATVIRQRMIRELRSAPSELLAVLDRQAPEEPGRQLPARKAPEELTDVLEELITAPREQDDARVFAEALEVITLLRGLTEARTTFATGIVVRYGTRERGVFRAEIGRNVLRLGAHAIPALIRTARHPNESIAQFAVDVLEWLRRDNPGAQVQVRDSAVLAAILDVFGATANRDTIPVLLSFSGSENPAVRKAARSSLAKYGRSVLWPMREKYENFTGIAPPRRWGWEKLSEELFGAQDKARQAQTEKTMDSALSHGQSKRFEKMAHLYGAILARWPEYERRAEMVPGLVEYADVLERQGEVGDARAMLTKASLLETDPAHGKILKARLLVINAEVALARGVADVATLEKALHLDPHNSAAPQLQQTIESRIERPPPHSYRMLAAFGIGLFAVACLGLFVVRALPSEGLAAGRTQRPPDEPKTQNRGAG